MSSPMAAAAAGGVPASTTRRHVLTGAAALARITATTSAVLASIPSWMELRIEAHRDASKALDHAADILEALEGASASLDRENPPVWLLEAQQAHDVAGNEEITAFAALLAQAPRSMADVEVRSRYLLGLSRCGGLDADPDRLVAFLSSMAGRES